MAIDFNKLPNNLYLLEHLLKGIQLRLSKSQPSDADYELLVAITQKINSLKAATQEAAQVFKGPQKIDEAWASGKSFNDSLTAEEVAARNAFCSEEKE
jgi:hypothetical protein